VFFASLFFAVGYGFTCPFELDPHGIRNFLDIWWEVVIAMLTMQSGGSDQVTSAPSYGGSEFPFLQLLEFLHMVTSYLLIGLFISMLYRKSLGHNYSHHCTFIFRVGNTLFWRLVRHCMNLIRIGTSNVTTRPLFHQPKPFG